jgi:hypothetical protein
MRRRWTSLAAALALAGAAITVSLVTASSAEPGITIHVIEHATTDTLVDTGAAGDTSGDLLTFHNDLYDATNTDVVGRDQGECVRIVTGAAGSWECRWVSVFPKTEASRFGTITVEGPFYDARDSTLAITGGTGAYRGATGSMRLKAGPGEGEFEFIFVVTF